MITCDVETLPEPSEITTLFGVKLFSVIVVAPPTTTPWIPLILNDDDATFPSSFETKTTCGLRLSLTIELAPPVIVEPLANSLKLYIKAKNNIIIFIYTYLGIKRFSKFK